ncbi:MAG: exodeoxyribonuclease VII large subunit, partial [Tomitella sp.]|nr:exodeoxyribonuclease VII large subunit [Tomitella sp.]
QIRSRPVLAEPLKSIDGMREEVTRLRDGVRRDVRRAVEAEDRTLEHLRARLTTLGPAATMARGYAVVQRVLPDGSTEVLRTADDAPPGAQLRVRVSDGAMRAAVIGRDE